MKKKEIYKILKDQYDVMMEENEERRLQISIPVDVSFVPVLVDGSVFEGCHNLYATIQLDEEVVLAAVRRRIMDTDDYFYVVNHRKSMIPDFEKWLEKYCEKAGMTTSEVLDKLRSEEK